MKISSMFKSKKPVISFEVFPPKLDTPVESIYEALDKLAALKPDFISVTYGAGGSKKDRTIEIASKIKTDYGIESMSHFTCVGQSGQEIDSLLEKMHDRGLENILALRGDPPHDQPDFDFSKNAYKYASELVHHIKSSNGFCIAAAAYAEGHVGCRRISEDMGYLKEKVDMGVDFLVTQLFFDNRVFYDFMEKARSIGINCPVTPCIMPVMKADQIIRMVSLCGASMPAKLLILVDRYRDNPDDMRKAGIEYAAAQIRDLIDNDADGIHLSTMNRPKTSREILKMAGVIK